MMLDAMAGAEGWTGSAKLAPEEALQRLLALKDALGITRIADITGLDIAGLPVAQVTRPLSLSNAVSQGKGETLAAAAVSAMFEAAESFFAERLDRYDTVTATARRLAVPQDRFATLLADDAGGDWIDTELPWVAAENLVTGETVHVPLELVHTAYTMPLAPQDGWFQASTTGLAAGFGEDHAILHGICECIERDAISRALATHGFLHRRRIDPESFGDQRLSAMRETLRRRGLIAGFWHAPSPTGLPVIWCHVMEDCPPHMALLCNAAEGSAAAAAPADAALAALCEAAQSRLTAISGARDDFTRANYPKYPDLQRLAAHRRLLLEGPRPVHAATIADGAAARSCGSVSGLVQVLRRRGFDQVYAVRIDTSPHNEIAVVKIVMPQLLPLVES